MGFFFGNVYWILKSDFPLGMKYMAHIKFHLKFAEIITNLHRSFCQQQVWTQLCTHIRMIQWVPHRYDHNLHCWFYIPRCLKGRWMHSLTYIKKKTWKFFVHVKFKLYQTDILIYFWYLSSVKWRFKQFTIEQSHGLRNKIWR